MSEQNPRILKDIDDRPEPVTYPAQVPAVRAVLRRPSVKTRLTLRKKTIG